jgi:hypothetical protein
MWAMDGVLFHVGRVAKVEGKDKNTERRRAMGARWLLAVAACGELAWAGMVSGACNPELLHKLRDRGFSNEEMLQLCGPPVEGPPTPSRPPDSPPPVPRASQDTPSRLPDKPPPVPRVSQERTNGARMLIRFEDDLAQYIKAHQQHDPGGTRKFTKDYIEKQMQCIAMAGSIVDTFAADLQQEGCQERHHSKKWRLYQCLKGHALERIILLFASEDACRKSREEIQALVETSYEIHR